MEEGLRPAGRSIRPKGPGAPEPLCGSRLQTNRWTVARPAHAERGFAQGSDLARLLPLSRLEPGLATRPAPLPSLADLQADEGVRGQPGPAELRSRGGEPGALRGRRLP